MRPSSGSSAVRRISNLSPLLCFLVAVPVAAFAQEAQTLAPRVRIVHPAPSVVTLAPLELDEQAGAAAIDDGATDPKGLPQPERESYRDFTSLRKAQGSNARTLTLRFSAAASLTHIQGAPDFPIEQGGTCVEGGWYAANSSCTVLVRFTPQGPGHRLGRLSVANSIDATPLSLGIGGNGSSPVISFTPSIISTLPQTISGGVGILSGASNLAVDGGDTLYMADTGNKLVRFLPSTGTLQNLSLDFQVTDPQGIAVDSFGAVYITQRNPATVQTVSITGGGTEYSSGGSGSCAYGSTCAFASGGLFSPGAITTDSNGTLFIAQENQVDRLIPTSNGFDNYVPLSNDYDNNSSYPNADYPLAVDSSDAIYAYESYNACFISSNPYYYASQDLYTNVLQVAGGRSCGFSGDGGQARGALISTRVAQMAFDLAGNFYFTDTNNQRVRRIDGLTGIITTIAGNGGIGNAGDGGSATNAQLSTPTGLALDSQGQIYIISSSSTSTSAQLVRKVGTLGYLSLPSEAVGTPSPAGTVTVANSGNAELDFTHTGFSSGNSSDFSLDPTTTSCNFTVPLASGRSCKIGFIFNPTTTGSRSATYSITSNTISSVNNIQVSGTGYTTATLTPSSFSYASTMVGSSSSSQTATLTNTGKAVLTINSILISGTNATSFTDTTSCGTTLAVGASCTVAITFKPVASGALTASLTVSDNALDGHQSVSVTGTGMSTAAKAVLSPTGLTFPATALGSTSASQTVKLTNSGTASLGITSITMAGGSGADFPFTQSCGNSLAAGASCNIVVSFKPAATGTRQSPLTVVTSAGTVTAGMVGTGTAASKAVTATSLATLNNPALPGSPLVFRASVRLHSASSPAGKVQLWEGSRMLAESVLQDGSSNFKLRHLRSGVHILHAVYPGDIASSPSRSGLIRQIVADRGSPLLP